jgi:hypothetical protein
VVTMLFSTGSCGALAGIFFGTTLSDKRRFLFFFQSENPIHAALLADLNSSMQPAADQLSRIPKTKLRNHVCSIYTRYDAGGVSLSAGVAGLTTLVSMLCFMAATWKTKDTVAW